MIITRVVIGLVLLVAVGAAVATLTGRTTMAGQYEEPTWTLEQAGPGFDVRRQGPVIEAQVTVVGGYNEAVNGAFRILAGYIFGGNAPRASIAMTTPVSAQPAGARIAMTTPVAAAPAGGSWTVSFTMPAAWTMETLPTPNDARIRLVEVPAARWAVRSFGGWATDGAVAAELAALERDVAAAGLSLGEETVVAQFNPPWVLGPWRRNEVRRAMVTGG